jgi:hypothetical protein
MTVWTGERPPRPGAKKVLIHGQGEVNGRGGRKTKAACMFRQLLIQVHVSTRDTRMETYFLSLPELLLSTRRNEVGSAFKLPEYWSSE